MEDKRNFVKINNGFMKDVEKYDHREQFYYLIIKGLANNLNKASSINIDAMAGILSVSTHSKNRKAIQDILLSMEEKQLLLLYEDIMLTKKIAVSEMKVANVYYAIINETDSSRGFTKIYYQDLLKFIGINDRYKDLLFAIYFNIIKRIFNTESSLDYSYVTIDVIAKETGINRKTVMSKIAIMMEHKILFCLKINESAEKDKNYYVRWDDRHALIDEFKEKGIA